MGPRDPYQTAPQKDVNWRRRKCEQIHTWVHTHVTGYHVQTRNLMPVLCRTHPSTPRPPLPSPPLTRVFLPSPVQLEVLF